MKKKNQIVSISILLNFETQSFRSRDRHQSSRPAMVAVPPYR